MQYPATNCDFFAANMNLNQKTALITGASRGIGLALAQLLLRKGARVAALGLNKPKINHPDFFFVRTDVRRQEEVDKSVALVKLWSEGSIDVLINNAGLGYFGKIDEMPAAQWHEMFDTNVNGLFYCTRAVLPTMKAQQAGHIVNIASTAALEGMPQVSGYCGTKWAVRGISESLYRELRDDCIKVTCVYPGSVKTDFFRNSPSIQPHDYMLMPGDVAEAIVHALETPPNFHTVNLEIRPLQPKGPKKS